MLDVLDPVCSLIRCVLGREHRTALRANELERRESRARDEHTRNQNKTLAQEVLNLNFPKSTTIGRTSGTKSDHNESSFSEIESLCWVRLIPSRYSQPNILSSVWLRERRLVALFSACGLFLQICPHALPWHEMDRLESMSLWSSLSWVKSESFGQITTDFQNALFGRYMRQQDTGQSLSSESYVHPSKHGIQSRRSKPT